MTAPERIWAWAWQTVPMGQWGITASPSSTEYIRADLAAVQPAQDTTWDQYLAECHCPQPDPRDEVIKGLVEALEVTRETAHSMAHSEFDGVWDQSDFDSYTPEADAALAAAKAVQHG